MQSFTPARVRVARAWSVVLSVLVAARGRQWGPVALLVGMLAGPAQAAFMPPAPALSAPQSASGSYTVSWSGIAGSADDRYTLEESSNGGSSWVVRVNNAPQISWTSPVQSGTRTYRVRYCLYSNPADGGNGSTQCSAWSGTKTVHIHPTGVPVIGCNGCGSPDTNGDLTITWTKPSGTITHYRVFSRRNNGAFQRTDVAGANTLSLAFSDLADGDWEFQVDACNTVLNTNCSLDDSAIKSIEVLKTPSVPAAAQASAPSVTGNFMLSWAAASGTVAHYSLHRAVRSGATCPTTGYGHVGNQSGTSRTFSSHGDGDFCFKVKACNSGSCSAASAGVSVSVLKLPTVPSLSAPATSASGSFEVSWSAAQETVERYELYRATAGATCTLPGQEGQEYCKHSETGNLRLAFLGHEDGTYRFAVKACNATGCSAPSAPATIEIEKSLAGIEDEEAWNLSVPSSDAVGTLDSAAALDGGTVNYGISLPVPPGRQGMAPGLSLNYRSDNRGEGIVGVGWSVSAGEGAVYRCPSLEAIDGVTIPFRGVVGDRLCLNGEQLMLASGAGYGRAGSTYHPETQPFTTVRLLGGDSTQPGSHFEVTDRSGTLRSYSRRLMPPREDGGTSYPTHWLLEQVRDLAGNTLRYHYASSDEEPVLDVVEYTGFANGAIELDGTRRVEFDYEARPLPMRQYSAAGFRSFASKRLAGIRTALDGDTVMYFRLRYEPSGASGRSLLKGVRLCKTSACASGQAYPETVFSYSEQAQNFVHRSLLADEFDELRPIGDIDGDGKTDYVFYDGELQQQPVPTELRLSSEVSPRDLTHWMNVGLASALDGSSLHSGKPRMVRDFNSDGIGDLISLEGEQVHIGFWDLENRDVRGVPSNLYVDNTHESRYFYIESIQDLDRDGDADLVIREVSDGVGDDVPAGTSYTYVKFNCETERRPLFFNFCEGRYLIPEWAQRPSSAHERDIIDFDGNGIPDLVYRGVSDSGVALPTYISFGSYGQHADGSTGTFWGTRKMLGNDLGGPASDALMLSLDVNGDGLHDYFDPRASQSEQRLWIGIGRGHFAATTVNGTIGIAKHWTNAAFTFDLDHDGRGEILVPDPNELLVDYCYLYFPTQAGGPPSEGPVEGIDYCAGGVHPIHASPVAHLDRAIYSYDRFAFVPQADGSYLLTRAESPVAGPIRDTGVCDSNDDGISDICYEIGHARAPVHNPTCDPQFDDQACTFIAGSHRGGGVTGAPPATLGQHALESLRGEDAFGIDLLKQATDGLGIVDAWNYGPLNGRGHSQCSYDDARPFYRADLEATEPDHYHFGATKTVVTRHRTSNGIGNGTNAECLRYEDAMFSTKSRGFQGFKAISVDEDLGDGQDKTVRTAYYDRFPLTGRTSHVETRLISDPPGLNPLSESVQEWLSATRADGTYHVYQAGRIDLVYNFDHAQRPLLSRTTVVNDYGATDLGHGNVSAQTTQRETLSGKPDETLLVSDSVRIDYDYDYSDAGSGWRDKVARKTVTVSPTAYGPVLPGPRPDGEANAHSVTTEDYGYYEDGTRRLERRTQQVGIESQESSQRFQYDTFGNVQRVTASAPDVAEDRVTVTHFGGDAYQPSYRIQGGFTTFFVHDERLGVLRQQDNPDGTRVEYDYDFAGVLTETRHSAQPPIHTVARWCTADCGQAVTQTLTLQMGRPERVVYADRLGRTVKTVVTGIAWGTADCDFGYNCRTITTAAYDTRGRVTEQSQPAATAGVHLTKFLDYDVLGRYRQKRVDRAGHAVPTQIWQYAYDGWNTTITLPGGSLAASRTYDSAGKLLSTTDAAGSTTHHRYDGRGNKVLTENALGTQVRHYYDALGRKTRTEDPDAGTQGAAAERSAYNGFGELIETRNARNDIVVTHYDALGRPTQRQVNEVQTARWIYDENGMPSLSREESGDQNGNGIPDYAKQFLYDDYGRVVRTELRLDGAPDTFVDEIAYDANFGRIKGRKYASGELVRYRYTYFGGLEFVSRPWGHQADEFAVDQQYVKFEQRNHRGQPEKILYRKEQSSDNVYGYFTYIDSTGDVESMLYERGVNGEPPLVDLRYYYDDAFGNLSRREDVAAGVDEAFTYDDLQRLDTSTTTWANAGIQSRSVEYDYDAVGNLTRKSDFGTVYHYGDSDRSAGGNAGPHAVRRVDLPGGAAIADFAYDDAGNMTAGMGRSVMYDAFNKPVQVSEGSGVSQFRYGPDLSVSVRAEGDRTVYYGQDYQLVVGAGGALTERTYINGHVVIESDTSERRVRHQHYDRLGSLLLVTDEQGEPTERHAFDAFGLPLAGDWQDNGGFLHPANGDEKLTERGYTGHEHLDRHKLVHMGGRIYDPRLGRFMSPDPYVQSETSTQAQNAYTYVMNNPLSGVDPSGYTCHGGPCSGGWEDYAYSRRIHQMQQPQYRHSMSGADMIQSWIGGDHVSDDRLKSAADALTDRLEAERSILASKSWRIRGSEVSSESMTAEWVTEGASFVQMSVGSLNLNEMNYYTKLAMAWNVIGNKDAQMRHSVGRYHQFRGDLVAKIPRATAEFAALSVASAGALHVGIPVVTNTANVLGRTLVGITTKEASTAVSVASVVKTVVTQDPNKAEAGGTYAAQTVKLVGALGGMPAPAADLIEATINLMNCSMRGGRECAVDAFVTVLGAGVNASALPDVDKDAFGVASDVFGEYWGAAGADLMKDY